jgi:hypothetical protein
MEMTVATAPAQYVRPALYLPRGTGNDKRRIVDRDRAADVQLVEETQETDERGNVVFSHTEIVTLPVGVSEIYTQNRMCGDYYCFIALHDKAQVSATGETLNDAFRAAAKRAERAA